MMYKLNHVLILVLLLILVSCKHSTQKDSTKFKRDIFCFPGRSYNLMYDLTQQKVAQLGLDTLQSGYDSLQIRIWYNYAFFNLRRLYIINYSKSKWSASVWTLNVAWDSATQTDSIQGYQREVRSPRSGWDQFCKKLFELRVMTLPDMYAIPGLRMSFSDGVGYDVEIATQHLYRFYSYSNPKMLENKYWQASNMERIRKLFEQEFGFVRD